MELQVLKNSLKGLLARLERGCGNCGCILMPPGGQRTTAGCKCDPYNIGAELRRLGRDVEAMTVEGNRWPDQPKFDLMWWGYLHSNGTVQVKRWFGDHKDYTEDCEGNDFVVQVVKPFAAASHEEAEEHIRAELKK